MGALGIETSWLGGKPTSDMGRTPERGSSDFSQRGSPDLCRVNNGFVGRSRSGLHLAHPTLTRRVVDFYVQRVHGVPCGDRRGHQVVIWDEADSVHAVHEPGEETEPEGDERAELCGLGRSDA